jgi:hypothetical protein
MKEIFLTDDHRGVLETMLSGMESQEAEENCIMRFI